MLTFPGEDIGAGAVDLNQLNNQIVLIIKNLISYLVALYLGDKYQLQTCCVVA